MANGIVVLGGYGDHGEEMALYFNGKFIASAEIDGSKDGHSGKVYDFLGEFGVSPKSCGITDIDVMDEEPDLVTDTRPSADDDETISEEKYNEMMEAGDINERGDYEYAENLSDMAGAIPELS